MRQSMLLGNFSDPPSLPEPWASIAAQLQQATRQLALVATALADQVKGAQLAPGRTIPAPLSVSELVTEFLFAKAKAGRSVRYLQTLHMGLAQFARRHGAVPVPEISARGVETWLHSRRWSLRTQANRLSEVRTLFAWAVRRGYLPQNPAATVELPDPLPEPIEVHTPEQVRAVLDAAGDMDPTLCRVLAIRYFTGLRSAEALRLAEADLRIEAGFVEVPAAKAKTRQRRLVPIRPALSAWLEWTGARGGRLPLRDEQRRLARVVRAAGVVWPHNVTRHSFCSYHLAAFQNAGQAALEAGHSETMLFAHYRAIVLPEAAERFWAVCPK